MPSNDKYAEMLSESFYRFEDYSENRIANDDSWRGFYDVEKAAEQCKFELASIIAKYTTSILEGKGETLVALKKPSF